MAEEYTSIMMGLCMRVSLWRIGSMGRLLSGIRMETLIRVVL